MNLWKNLRKKKYLNGNIRSNIYMYMFSKVSLNSITKECFLLKHFFFFNFQYFYYIQNCIGITYIIDIIHNESFITINNDKLHISHTIIMILVIQH